MERYYQKAKDALNKHQVIAFPTETVFGLGVYYDDEEAYHLLNKIKRRKELVYDICYFVKVYIVDNHDIIFLSIYILYQKIC